MISGNFLGGLGVLRGMWQYLTARSRARADVEKARIALEKDRERNQAVAGYIAHLPENAELMDLEDREGRSIWIRKHGCSPPAGSGAVLQPKMMVLQGEVPIAGPSRRGRPGADEIAP